jgi:hypothetical protein
MNAEELAAIRESHKGLDDAGRLLAHIDALTAKIGDHVPAGGDDNTGYGEVWCSCGEWDSAFSDRKGYPSWSEHIIRAEA